MTIATFEQKARAGGWIPENNARWRLYIETIKALVVPAEIGLLDPLAWQAVGKVEGWEINSTPYAVKGLWHAHMLGLVDALAEGKTIEQYLESLTSTSMN